MYSWSLQWLAVSDSFWKHCQRSLTMNACSEMCRTAAFRDTAIEEVMNPLSRITNIAQCSWITYACWDCKKKNEKNTTASRIRRVVSVKVGSIYLSDKTCSQSNNFHVLDANFMQISTAESLQHRYIHTDNMPCNVIQFSLKFLHIAPTFSFSVNMSCF